MQDLTRHHLTHRSRTTIFLLSIFVLTLLFPSPAAASNGGGLFDGLESFLDTIIEAFTGAIGKSLAVLGIVAGGILWMLADSGSGMRKVAATVIGAAVVIGAVTLVDLLGFTGTVLPGVEITP